MYRSFAHDNYFVRPDPEDKNTIILGPLPVNQLDQDHIRFDIEDGELILFSPELGRGVKLVIPVSVWGGAFNDYMEYYYASFQRLPALLKMEFQDVIAELKGYEMVGFIGTQTCLTSQGYAAQEHPKNTSKVRRRFQSRSPQNAG